MRWARGSNPYDFFNHLVSTIVGAAVNGVDVIYASADRKLFNHPETHVGCRNAIVGVEDGFLKQGEIRVLDEVDKLK